MGIGTCLLTYPELSKNPIDAVLSKNEIVGVTAGHVARG